MARGSLTHPVAAAAITATVLLAVSSPGGAAPRRSAPETISVFAGPCRDGGCAVYRVAVRSDGTMSYSGLAHTNVLGSRNGAVGRATFDELASTLAPYRPQGQGEGCSARDAGPTYRITWSGARGTRTLYHTLGCNTARDNVLDAILTNAPARLGIEDWASAQQSPVMQFKPHIFYF